MFFEPEGGDGGQGRGATSLFVVWDPHFKGSSFTDRRHFHHCRQCIERSLLHGVPGVKAENIIQAIGLQFFKAPNTQILHSKTTLSSVFSFETGFP
jgi:hypothetical protein